MKRKIWKKFLLIGKKISVIRYIQQQPQHQQCHQQPQHQQCHQTTTTNNNKKFIEAIEELKDEMKEVKGEIKEELKDEMKEIKGEMTKEIKEELKKNSQDNLKKMREFWPSTPCKALIGSCWGL